jgi:hypothetical protein
MIRSYNNTPDGELISTNFTRVTVDESGSLFTRLTIVVDSMLSSELFEEDVVMMLDNIKVNNIIATTGNILKKVIKIVVPEKKMQLLYLNYYSVNPMLKDSDDFEDIAGSCDQFIQGDSRNTMVIVEDYRYVITK